MTRHTPCLQLLLVFVAVGATTSPPAGAQCLADKWTPPQVKADDRFGSTIWAGDSHVFVTATEQPGVGGSETGDVYVFEDSPNGWVQTAILGQTMYSLFGESLDYEAGRLFMGTPWGAGVVLVYEQVGGAWTETASITASDGDDFDAFGGSVSALGDLLLVGAPGDENAGTEYGQGSAYVFEHGPSGWTEVQKLLPNDPIPYGLFGTRVALVDESTALITRPVAFSSSPFPGAVYVFERAAGTWSQVDKIEASDGHPWDGFGFSLAVDGDRALIGAPWNNGGTFNNDSGAAYVLERGVSGWAETARLVPGDLMLDDWFGCSTALRGSVAVIGAERDDSSGTQDAGSAYVFEFDGAGWTQVAELMPEDSDDGKYVGRSVAITGQTLLVGAPYDDETASEGGSVLVYELGAGTPYCTAAPNSTGSGALIEALTCGPPSVSGNGLVLSAGPVPNQPGIFYYGPMQTLFPFGDGWRCVGGSQVHRLPAVFPEGGVLSHAVDLNSPPSPSGQITAGSTWYFQAWYRDPAAGATGFNLSDGLELSFVP